jgi:tungstate transport system substrate-binding protein
MLRRLAPAATLAAVLLAACRGTAEPPRILLGTTTSVQDTGLADELVRAFSAADGRWRLVVVAVGSGQALRMAERGDFDVVITHAPADEAAFMAAGHGESRAAIMSNEFVLLGPPADPAGAAGLPLTDGLRRIAGAAAPFISRGDASGTHQAELAILADAGVEAPWAGYTEAGAGMADVLRVASARGAYTLSDRATWEIVRAGVQLRIVHEGDARLDNPYSVIVPRGARNAEGARAFAAWLAGAAGQLFIAGFTGAGSGQPLFQPVAP